MSEIIIFPKLQNKLHKEIIDSMQRGDYESAYDLFNTYEKHFEMDEGLSLLRLECLLQTNSYLELREESSILLNQGHQAYNEIIVYLIKSLIKLKQFQTVMELVDSLRGEQVPHQLIMQLNVLYDEAKSKLIEKKAINQQFVIDFMSYPIDKQKNILMTLIQEEDFKYQMSFIHIISLEVHPEVQTLILMYLKLSGYQHSLMLNKLKIKQKIEVSSVEFVQHHPFNQVINGVIDVIENQQPSIVETIVALLTMHHFILYPFHELYFQKHLNDLNDIEQLKYHYLYFIQEITGVSGLFEQNTFLMDEDMLQKIRQLSEVTV
ncbi:hypothetical protein [Macrococcus sp. DPC7161]|uniref:hypothetical protein n=1 Tax=Macrococcus sp. DPC7161 TaxID=2507060 RepID=UPI00100B9050|nr:hypothetical protein [Macrococcus sp. DPC7161]RXK18172.1 hypothetical protein ER639_05640 [Macrococcus sp. DPC7161]